MSARSKPRLRPSPRPTPLRLFFWVLKSLPLYSPLIFTASFYRHGHIHTFAARIRHGSSIRVGLAFRLILRAQARRVSVVFARNPAALRGRLLFGGGVGRASFTAEVCKRGVDAVVVDLRFGCPADTVEM